MNNEEYRDEGFRLYNEDREKALECFMKAAEGKDIPSGVAIAVYYYEDCEDDDANKHAKDWIEKVFEWYEEKEEEENAFYVGAAHNLRGQMYYYDEYNNAMAWLEFCQAADLGYAGAYSFLGDMLYAGDWTADGNPDVNGALEQWQQGMELGDERSKELYEEHQHELMNDPVEVSFDNGNHYRGDVNAEGQPHGSGHMDYKLNGYYGEYDGEWKNGMRCGKGHYHQFSKGGRRYTSDYKGEWLDDKEHGQGVATESSEKGLHCATVTETYTGEFREGKRHGHGVVVSDNFDGNFTNGENRFESDFEDGKAVGAGVWDYANGDHLEYDADGHGVYTFKSGLRFEGVWENSMLQADSIKADPSIETPMLVVKEHHSGFDYDQTGTFLLLLTEVGYTHYADAMTISKDSSFNMKGSGINIMAVTPDSVTIEVKAKFFADNTAQQVTIHRGESLQFKDARRSTATIYDEDYDYTIEDSLEVKCV